MGRTAPWWLGALLLCGCGDGAAAGDGGAGDAGLADAGSTLDAGRHSDAGLPPDAGPTDGAPPAADAGVATLGGERDRLFALYARAEGTCERWAALDPSQRAVFLILSHRLWISRTPDERRLLEHADDLYLILGGGADGRACGGAANNRLFLSTDEYAWALLVDAWNREPKITDGGEGTFWDRSADLAGPHDPFDGSAETQSGLECILLFETSGSRPPTAQAHFFVDAASVAPVSRGAGIDLPADPTMLEVDHDFNCVHESNPLCRTEGWDREYADTYGDYECDWVPAGCAPLGDGCHRSATREPARAGGEGSETGPAWLDGPSVQWKGRRG